MKKRLYIITFLAVAAVIHIVGFVGMELALKYWQKQYIKIQLDVNKSHAERTALFLTNELKSGLSQEAVIKKFQETLIGTDIEKGYLCMFDQKDAQLLCHPNTKMVGMKIPESMQFKNDLNSKAQRTYDIITGGEARGGLFLTQSTVEIAYMVPVKGAPWMMSVHENIDKIKEEAQNQREVFFIGFIFLSVITAFFATFMARLIARRYEKTIEAQNKILEDTNEELKSLNTELNLQKEKILQQRNEIEEQKNNVTQSRDEILYQKNQITSSIQYASRIQEALLPPQNYIDELFKEYFILYEPRDIVSGDFYWAKKINNFVIFAAADSTGHGVPGAFMSMLGISYLNEIVSEEFYSERQMSAANILNDLRLKVKSSLRQSDDKDSTKDGIDIALIILDTQTLELQFAGAYNPLYIIRDETLVEVNADRMPVGIYTADNTDFTNKRIELVKGDCIYLFSDGYYDQFGGNDNRKFLTKKFKSLILENSSLPMSMQKINLEENFINWKHGNSQVDDVLVVGIKI